MAQIQITPSVQAGMAGECQWQELLTQAGMASNAHFAECPFAIVQEGGGDRI
jgi:hypothetical protein